ncbi:MAG: glycosyltransferase family 2 protein [Parcubacteria group bacterium]|jgi:glycosyltransferase involved in cell wall biosynthesis
MRFSIVTCTYNSAKYLQENIDSVEAQTYEDFEHIFIDGFSTDGTMAIIEKYRQKHPDRVKVFQSEPRGISHAMNEGIERSSGQYINHLHSDDSFYDHDVLKNVSDFIQKNDSPDWIYGKAHVINTINNTSLVVLNGKSHHKIRFWYLLLMNYVMHQSVFLKKDVFDVYGTFDENLRSNMDYDMWLRLAKNKVRSRFIDTIICNFHMREDSQTTLTRHNNEHEILYKKYCKSTLLIAALLYFDKMHEKRMAKKNDVYKI